MSFRISYNLKISPFAFDYVDWYEFLWHYERLSKQIEQSRMDQANASSNNQLMSIIGGE